MSHFRIRRCRKKVSTEAIRSRKLSPKRLAQSGRFCSLSLLRLTLFSSAIRRIELEVKAEPTSSQLSPSRKTSEISVRKHATVRNERKRFHAPSRPT